MMFSSDEIEASYAYCRQTSRRASSSFYAGFLLLPREKRRAMEALYAFMRHTDDLADGVVSSLPVRGLGTSVPSGEGSRFKAQGSSEGERGERREEGKKLAAWRTALQEALQAENETAYSVSLAAEAASPPPSALRPPPSAFPPLLPALADAVRRFHIPHEYLFAVIDGVALDLAPKNFETFEQLERYCELVASAVGLACIHVWGFRGSEAFEPARQMGVALQLTNILRDLREDAAAGRVYLPMHDLEQCGYSIADLRAGVANEDFHRLMRLEIDRAERFYRGGAELMEWLEPDGRRIFGLMTDTYHQLLKRIERRPAEVLRRRVRVGSFTKFRLFSRWMLLPPR